MIKKTILRRCMVTSLFAMCFTLINVAMATAGCGDCNNPPTSAGNAEYPCSSTGAKLTIVATYSDITATDKETISPTRSVTLKATGGRPLYKWSTTSKGYNLSKTEGETVTLSVDSGTCGTDYDIYATVTVTDVCGVPYTIQIRNSSGHWGTSVSICSQYINHQGSNETSTLIVGDKKYTLEVFEYNPQTAHNFICSGTPNSCDAYFFDDTIGPMYIHQPVTYRKITVDGGCELVNSGGNVHVRIHSLSYQLWTCQ